MRDTDAIGNTNVEIERLVERARDRGLDDALILKLLVQEVSAEAASKKHNASQEDFNRWKSVEDVVRGVKPILTNLEE